MIRRAGPGRPPATSTPHALITRRRCWPTARCSSQGEVSMAPAAISRARNSTTRRAGLGRPRAASTPHALLTRRPCCPTARCWSQGDRMGSGVSRARNCTIRRAELGAATGSLGTARNWHTATLLPDGKVLVAGGLDSSGNLASAELYDPASGIWRPPAASTPHALLAHGDLAA